MLPRIDYVRQLESGNIPQLGITVPAAAMRRFWTRDLRRLEQPAQTFIAASVSQIPPRWFAHRFCHLECYRL